MLIVVLALSLSSSPVLAQSLQESIQKSAAAFQLQQAQPSGGGIPPVYRWTGVSLLGAGSLAMFAGAHQTCDDPFYDCGAIDMGVFLLGTALAGTGVVLFVVGKNKGDSLLSQELVTTPRGVALRGRIRFR